MSTPSAPHLLLVCSSLGSGGAERVLTTLANGWVERGTRVTLVTLSDTGSDFYHVDARVTRVGLDLLRPSLSRWEALTSNWRRGASVRRTVRAHSPDVVISFMDRTNILVLLATRLSGRPVIVSERIDPRFYTIPAGWRLLRHITYPWADALVVQTQAVAEWARTVVPPSQVSVIPNPLSSQPPPAGAIRENHVVAMGRLDPQKGFDLLVSAFARIAEKHPAWHLHIYGEGPQREELQAAIAQVNLSDRIHLKGRTTTPQEVLSSAGMFVLSSRFEGMPNVLLEAMSCGAPCISFDCPSGPAEIIDSGRNGLLVPAGDVASLAAAMDDLMNQPEKRTQLGEAAVEVGQRFSLEAVLAQWNALIKTLR